MELRKTIEHSVVAARTEPTRLLRHEQIDQQFQGAERLVLHSIDAAVRAAHMVGVHTEQRKMARHGYKRIGAGAESVVFQHGASVVKYVRGSEWFSADQQNELVEMKQAAFTTLREHLDPFLAEQTISAAPHIAQPHKHVVQTAQPFLRYTEAFNADADGIRLDPRMGEELERFVAASNTLYTETGYLPDTNGANNLVNVEGKLMLIDTQPIGVENPELQEKIQRQLGAITAFLERL